jgi:hypothetical protein
MPLNWRIWEPSLSPRAVVVKLSDVVRDCKVNSQDFANLDLPTARRRLELIYERCANAIRSNQL